MPVIKRQQTLLPEGEYCGQARKVSQEYIKNTGATIFRVPLHLPNGQTITTILRVGEKTMWVFDQVCKSGSMNPPDNSEEYQITTDDLEDRVFWFGYVHAKLDDGRTVGNVKFHTKTYAVQENPALAEVKFPNAAPPITLRAVGASREVPSPLPPPGASAGSTTKVDPPPIAPVPGITEELPDELPGITAEEDAEALAYAKKLRQRPKAEMGA